LLLLCYSLRAVQRKKGDYVTITDYVDHTNHRDGRFVLNKDTLFIYFETAFNHDTLELTVGNDKRLIYLTTNEVLGVSDVQKFGNIQSIENFKISLNGRKEHTIQIKDKSMNKWSVNFWNDTMKITVLKHVPFYD
jgi:hypothetical protein